MDNLFQVARGDHIDEIFERNRGKIVVLMFGTSYCGPCQKVKPDYVKLAQHYNSCIFLYADLNAKVPERKFYDNAKKYSEKVVTVPKFHIFFDGTQVGNVDGPRLDEVSKSITIILRQIEASNKAKEEIQIILKL